MNYKLAFEIFIVKNCIFYNNTRFDGKSVNCIKAQLWNSFLIT